MSFAALHVNDAPQVAAPDGSTVHVLVRTERGSMARFTLPAGAVSRAVQHRTVDEVWYFVGGRGRMWLHDDARDTIIDVEAGLTVSIPCGTAFQFCAASAAPLQAIGVTMPPWPGEGEATLVEGPWPPTL